MYGIKGNMTEAYLGEVRVPVTKVKIPTHIVSQIKTEEKDGYKAIQVAFGRDRKNPTKAIKGHLKNTKKVPHFIREIPAPKEEVQVGDQFTLAELIERGDVVSVQGVTKGKGFTGAIKRWGFSRQPKTHGQSDRVRATGSIGQGTGVGHVFKGKKMPGRLGGFTRSVKNSKVIFIDLENNEIWITGAVPGNTGGLIRLTITKHLDNLPKIGEEKETQEQSSPKPIATPSEEKVEPEKKVKESQEKITKPKPKKSEQSEDPSTPKNEKEKGEAPKTETKGKAK